MIGLLRRRAYTLVMAGLVVLIVVVGGFLVMVALPDLLRADGASGSPTPGPAASPRFMTWFGMPIDADCAGCHVTEAGSVGLRSVPAIAHPLAGWSACNECHAPDRLVATAAGHTGLHAPDCLLCHQPGELLPPLSRPHRELQNTACLECHGTTAPLPTDMAHRRESVCWLCHRQPAEPPPVPRHEVFADQTDCLRCHVAGVVGALPTDHLTRTAGECLLCHEPAPGATIAPSNSPRAAP